MRSRVAGAHSSADSTYPGLPITAPGMTAQPIGARGGATTREGAGPETIGCRPKEAVRRRSLNSGPGCVATT